MADSADRQGRGGPPGEAPGEAAACPIVGIGASAGGVEALRRFFAAIEPDCGMAFVVVQHLDPGHPSSLAQILARSGKLPVRPVEHDAAVEPGAAYVIPQDAILTIRERRLLLTRPAPTPGHRTPVDEFLVSLARDQTDNAACVILSGTGSDGTLGLRAIKESGGLTLAQGDAEYGGMMRSAVATGLVDFVLRPEEMPRRLASYFSHKIAADRQSGRDDATADEHGQLAQICTLLRLRTGNDFSGYKGKTMLRRVQRRMHVLQTDDVAAFIERLRSDPHEVELLFQDLLIGVTSFFREPRSFDALERSVVPALFEGRGPNDTIRVWVPGCSTGEEAYSLAILLRECAPKPHAAPRIQIFASDIDERSLQLARQGRFPAAIANDIPGPQLKRYFTREDGTYRIADELREMCLFSTHNLLRDAPFSRLDLISCRNVLIYFEGSLQDRIVPLFHYALRPNGYLFLGSSENVTRHPRLFATVDKAHRIFQRRALFERRLPEFPLVSPDAAHRTPSSSRAGGAQPTLQAIAEQEILQRYAPAYVMVNAEGDVLFASGRTGKYLELPAGAPDNNVFNLARPGLRLELRAAIHKAMQSGERALQTNVTVGTNGSQQDIHLHVQPIRQEDSAPLYMVVFQDLGGVRPLAGQELSEADENAEAASVRHLDMELRAIKERLQATTEELESSNEELRSGNEELSSMNEELQSANEELETSKEELQSINEELQTVNAELGARVEELSRTNSDIANLLESTQLATVFLDRELNVRSFTPTAKEVFRLVESDAGRPIAHVRARVGIEGLEEDAARVLRTLGAVEKQVRSTDGDARYVMRILPYRTVEDVISGIVLTFTDVTRVTAAEVRVAELAHDLRDRVDSLETLLDLLPVGVLVTRDRAAADILVNRCGARLMGDAAEQAGMRPVGSRFRIVSDGEELPPERQPLRRSVATGEPVSIREATLEREDGSTTEIMLSATPLFDAAGEVRGGIGAMVDISEIKQAEARQQALLLELQHRVKNILATVSSLATRMVRARMSVEEFHAAFLARLTALGRIHDLLSQGAWAGANLRSAIAAVLEPYRAATRTNIRIDGDDFLLHPNAAATLGLVLHELATNAAKYGALSTPEGRVELAWAVRPGAGGPELALTWTERGGPPVAQGPEEGFGTRFVRRSVEYELQGGAELNFAPDGLACMIAFPFQGNLTENPERPWSEAAK